MVLNFIDSTDKDKTMKELLEFLDIKLISNVLMSRHWGDTVKLFPVEWAEVSTNLEFPHTNKSLDVPVSTILELTKSKDIK